MRGEREREGGKRERERERERGGGEKEGERGGGEKEGGMEKDMLRSFSHFLYVFLKRL